MRTAILRLALIVLGCVAVAPHAHAQAPTPVELPCPAGTQPIQGGAGITYNPSTGKYRYNFCQDQFGTLLDQAGAPPANSPGIPALNGTAYYVTNYGVNANALNFLGCSGTNAPNTLTCTGGNFIITDVGYIVWESGTANTTPDLPQTTITGVTSTTVATVSGAFARTSVAGGEAVIGTDQTSNMNTGSNLQTALLNACNNGQGVVIHLPAGGMIIQGSILTQQNAACDFDQKPFGTTIMGEGFLSSVFYPSPTFTYNSTSQCAAGGGHNGIGCIGPNNTHHQNYSLYGGYGGNIQASNTFNGCWIMLATPGTMWNVVMQSYLLQGSGQTVCMNAGTTSLWNVDLFGFGPNSCGAGSAMLKSSGGFNFVYDSYLNGNCSVDGASLTVSAGSLWVKGLQGQSGAQHNILVSGGQLILDGSSVLGISCTGAGVICQINNSYTTTASTAYASLLNVASGAKMTVSGSNFTATGGSGSGVAVAVDATSTFVDGCGNTLTAFAGTATITAGGKFYPCPASLYNGTNTLTNTYTPTGTGACATITTKTGDLFAGTFTCTGTTGASTITLTFGTSPKGNGWKCVLNDQTTTADTITPTAGTSSTCAASAASIAANDVIQFSAASY